MRSVGTARRCTSSGNPSTSSEETYTVNALGQPVTLTDRNGNVHTYSYDVLGRMASEGRTIAGVTRNMSYAYNLDGSVATMTYPSGAVITYMP